MSISTFLILLVAVISVNTAATVESRTVPGFTYIGSMAEQTERAGLRSTSFYLSQDVANQVTARSNCKKYFDGSLVTMLNANKDNSVREMLEENDPNNWIEGVWTAGKRDYKYETQWYWSTTLVPIRYYKWLPGYPKNCDDYDYNCISLHGRGQSYGWANSFCIENMHYICEA